MKSSDWKLSPWFFLRRWYQTSFNCQEDANFLIIICGINESHDNLSFYSVNTFCLSATLKVVAKLFRWVFARFYSISLAICCRFSAVCGFACSAIRKSIEPGSASTPLNNDKRQTSGKLSQRNFASLEIEKFSYLRELVAGRDWTFFSRTRGGSICFWRFESFMELRS